MLLNIVNIDGTEILSIDNYSNATDYKSIINDSKDKFIEAKNKNVFVRCDFDDDLWLLFNEKIELKLKFDFSELDFRRYAKNRFNCTFKEFKELAKAYIVTLIPHLSARSINRVISHITTVAKRTDFFTTEKAEDFIDIDNSKEFTRIESTYFNAIEFFKIIPMNNSIEFTEILEDIFWELTSLNKNNSRLQRRALSDFYSVLLFDKVINYWWDNTENLDEKIAYYPIYIWWKLTSILPLRVVELSVLPYNCTYHKDDKYFVRVRRSMIKGKNGSDKKQKIYHNLNSDYKIFEYEVTKDIFDILEGYKNIILQHNPDDSRREESDVLFDKKVLISHKKRLKMPANHSKSANMDIFTYIDLRNLLTLFYNKIISDKFGFNVVKKGIIESEMLDINKAMSLDKITKINLGDTRHIAMINMSLNDFNPILIKDFVNHSDINTTYHYSQNIEKVVKCMTYMKYQQLRKREANSSRFEINNGFSSISVLSIMDNDSNFKEVDNGRCYSTKFLKGDITDCLTSGFEIGDCNSCDYFVQHTNYTDEQTTQKTETLENALKREGFFFANALKKYSRDSNDADFKKALLRLQTSASQYQSQLEKNIREI